MRDSIRLGRLAGIPLGMHWSVLAIFALIAFGLSEGRFPQAHPGAPTGAYWAAGLGTAVVFFLALLAHELSHALVARREGVPVEGITLWIFGGVARMRGEVPSARSELRIAGVGPLVSLVLGMSFLALAGALEAGGAGALTVEAVIWLGGINVLLAVLNVVPAAPLDGGRVLRALVWWRTGDPFKGTRVATGAGRGFGAVLIGVGLALFLARSDASGLWLALIGWFVLGTATVEGRVAVARDALRDVRAWRVMSRDPLVLPAARSVANFLDHEPARYRFGEFPVADDAGRLVGLVTGEAIDRVPAEERERTPLGSIACPVAEVAVASPQDSVADLLPRMGECAAGRALVLDSGRLVGLITPADLNRAMAWAGPAQDR